MGLKCWVWPNYSLKVEFLTAEFWFFTVSQNIEHLRLKFRQKFSFSVKILKKYLKSLPKISRFPQTLHLLTASALGGISPHTIPLRL